jgi:hypothetical protein
VQSTAPLNVEDEPEQLTPDEVAAVGQGDYTVRLEEQPPDEAVAEIARFLNQSPRPRVVISVHGFNAPRPAAITRLLAQFRYLLGDPAIPRGDGLVWIGYRWPSERLGLPFFSSLSATPVSLWGLVMIAGALLLSVLYLGLSLSLPQWRPYLANGLGVIALVVLLFGLASRSLRVAALIVGLILVGIGYFLRVPSATWAWVAISTLGLLAALLLTIPLALILLRTVVYYRDVYRALNYAVPDLVELLRVLHREVERQREALPARPDPNDVALCFLGHSMGAFVVTHVVRILSDVFDERSIVPLSGEEPERDPEEAARIGRVFRLERLLLVSPDIPAETLVVARSNYLQASLRRFREAYLFSNEGDEVLHSIATLANFFTFPTGRRRFGFRLGNTAVGTSGPAPEYGVLAQPASDTRFLSRLRLGELTLDELSRRVREGEPEAPYRRWLLPLRKTRARSVKQPIATLPTLFSYFDCTDYSDVTDKWPDRPRPLLSRARRKSRLRAWDHWDLLLSYLFGFRGHVDVHSGYFAGHLCQELMYRLVCLGYDGLWEALPVQSNVPNPLSAICEGRGIRVLISPVLTTPKIIRREVEKERKASP